MQQTGHPLRIGILGHNLIEWTGGLDFLRLVCSTLNASGAAVELHFLLPDRGPRAWSIQLAKRLLATARHALGRSSGLDFAPSTELVMGAVRDSVGAMNIHHIDLGEAALARSVDRLALDVLLPAIFPLSNKVGVPWLAQIYDFQHRLLPHYFTATERSKRDHVFTRLLQEAPVVVFNSATVMADARRFLPPAKAHLVQLPLSAAPVGSWFELDVAATQRRYGVERPYFMICNQFWLHKDHRTAFLAFSDVAKSNPDILLICTGSTSDPRNPRHMQELTEGLKSQGLLGRVRVLGLIPKPHQIALLRGALALVQPTQCEGTPGGLAAYDAVALGVPIIASDIPVNLELQEAGVQFFRAGDAEALSIRMLQRLTCDPAVALSPGELLARGMRRQANFGATLVKAIKIAQQ